MANILTYSWDFFNAIPRLVFEPLGVLLLAGIVIGFPDLKQTGRKSGAWGFLVWALIWVLGGRFVELFLLRIDGSVRYLAPFLFFLLVCSGPILVCLGQSMAERLKFKNSAKAGKWFLLAILVCYGTMSIMKTERSFRLEDKVVHWAQVMKEAAVASNGNSFYLLDQSKRGAQILYYAGIKECSLQILHASDGLAVFLDILRVRDQLREYSTWWLFLERKQLPEFKTEVVRYAGAFPFTVGDAGYGYCLLRYGNSGAGFPVLPVPNLTAESRKELSPADPVLWEKTRPKVLLLGDALFSTGLLPRKLLGENPKLTLLGGDPASDKTTGVRWEGLANATWDYFLHHPESRLLNHWMLDFVHYRQNYLGGEQPDFIVISLGLSGLHCETEEFVHNARKSTAAMRELLAGLSAQLPQAQIGILVPLPPPSEEHISSDIKHPEFIDYYSRFQQEAATGLKNPRITVIPYHIERKEIYDPEKFPRIKKNYMSAISDSTAALMARAILGWIESKSTNRKIN